MALTDDLVAFWSFEEASGTRTDDHGTNDLAETGGTIANATGKVGNAADFESVDGRYLSIADNAALSMGNIDFTLAAWVNAESFPGGDRSIIAKGDATNGEYYLQYREAATQFRWNVHGAAGFGSAGQVLAATLGTPSTATWYFIVAWHDATGNVVGIQVNNGTADTSGFTAGVLDGTAAFHVGSYPGFTQHWDGLIDQVGVWKRLLTTQEKTDLYNGGSGLSYAAMSGGGGGAGIFVFPRWNSVRR